MPERIKVVHILPTLDRGGAEKITVDLILHLDLERFSPQVILFKWGGFWVEKLRAHNIPVTVLKKRKGFDPINFWRLFKALRKIKPDIVHTHLGGDIYGRLAARLLRVPVVIATEHNVNDHESRYLTSFKKLTASWVDKLVAVSQAVCEDSIKRYNLNPDRVALIYNGIDLQVFNPAAKSDQTAGQAPNGKQDRPIIIGTIGRLSPQKGHLSLVEAASLAKTHHWVIKIAGAGELHDTLEKRIKAAKLENNIQLVGLVDRPEEFLKTLDVFIFPSLWEGLGIAVLEAAAMGLPIISSNIAPVQEIIDEDSGFIFPAGDSATLATMIDWISNNFYDPSVRQKAERAQEKVRQNFSLETSRQAYEKLYSELYSSAKSRNSLKPEKP